MKEALEQAIHQTEEQQGSCPACGSEQVQTQGSKRRVLLTSFGRVEVLLKRLRCQQCRHFFRSAERCLAEVKGHNVTPDLQGLAALVGSSWPYKTAAGVLKRLSGVQLSDERLRQLTNEQGSALAEQQSAQAQQVLKEAVSMSQIRAQRAQSGQDVKKDQLKCLQVGLDGGWLPSHEQKGGMEGKIGAVASQSDPVGKRGRQRITKRRYVATFGPCVGYLAHPFVKWMVLLLISSFFSQLSFFTDEGGQDHLAYLHAFSESHPLPQRRWQRERLFQVLQKQHGGTQYALSSGSSASLLKRSGHSSVLVV